MISSGKRYECALNSNSEKWLIDADDSHYRPPTPDEVAQKVLASQSDSVASVQVLQTTGVCWRLQRPDQTYMFHAIARSLGFRDLNQTSYSQAVFGSSHEEGQAY